VSLSYQKKVFLPWQIICLTEVEEIIKRMSETVEPIAGNCWLYT
jgi:hypothetical protein